MSQGQAALDPRTPVVVAVGQVEQRTTDLAGALEPTALLARAARAAAADAGSDRLLAALDTVAVIRILSWRYRDPAALVARLDPETMLRTRRWFTSFGSCSVLEPHEDLVELGVIA